MRGLKRKNLTLKICALLIALFGVILTFFPGAVENDGDVSDKLLVVSVGVDKTDEGLRLSGVSAQPKASGTDGGQVTGLFVEAEGRSIAECVNRIQQETGRVVDLGLCGVIVIGEELGKSGVKTLLETVLSSNLISPGSFVVQADGVSAKKVIEQSLNSTDSATVILSGLMKDAERNCATLANTLLKFLSETGGKSGNSTLPLLSFSKAESQSQSGESDKESADATAKYKANGMESLAVYKDGKLIDKLTPLQSKGLSWSDNHVKQGVMVKENFTVEGDDVGTVSAELAKKSFGLSVKLEDGKPTAEIKVEATFRSADRERVNKVSERKGIKAKRLDEIYEQNFKEEIEKQIYSALEYGKNNGVDLFGIEQEFYRFKTKKYKSYIEGGGKILDECDVSLKVSIKIQ